MVVHVWLSQIQASPVYVQVALWVIFVIYRLITVPQKTATVLEFATLLTVLGNLSVYVRSTLPAMVSRKKSYRQVTLQLDLSNSITLLKS